MNDDIKLALFIDFENLAIGVQTALYKKFEISLLTERLLEKGKIVEQGLHTDLVNKEDGVYAKLHRTQMEMNEMVAIR